MRAREGVRGSEAGGDKITNAIKRPACHRLLSQSPYPTRAGPESNGAPARRAPVGTHSILSTHHPGLLFSACRSSPEAETSSRNTVAEAANWITEAGSSIVTGPAKAFASMSALE